jgi:hypothetical protein
VHAYKIYATVTGKGGSGGGSTAGSDGVGGAGHPTAKITGAYYTLASATGFGGYDSQQTGAPGGTSEATAGSYTTSLSTTRNSAAIASAGADSDRHNSVGPATATAVAQTSNGQLATAAETTNGSADTGQATATTAGFGVVTTVSAVATTSGLGTQNAQTEAAIGGTLPIEQGSSFGAFAFASGVPASGVNTIIAANSNISTALGGANAVILAYAAQGAAATGAAAGTQTLTSTDTFTVDAARLTGDLILGLAAPQFAGTPFTSLTLATTIGGVTDAGASGTFTTQAAAQSFFADDAIDLGAVSAVDGLTMQISETMVTSTSGDAFDNEMVLGATGGYGAPVFAGPAAIARPTASPEAVSGVSLSEIGNQTGESYSVTADDNFGTLALIQSGADVVTGSGSTSLTITGTLVDVNAALATLTDTDAASRADTIMWNANSVDGGDATLLYIGVVCFLAGTRILTGAGERPVEALCIGDKVMTLSGKGRPISWIGKGSAASTRGRRTATTPVIVRRGALADNVPTQDLRVTKGHSLYIDDVLIPVEFLINHRNIVWDDHAQNVTIYHIELETRDILIANGAAAESYRDDGNRWLFGNQNSNWDEPPQEPCAPVTTGGPIVDAIWRRLLDRAGPRPGLPLTDDPDLHLLVDGVRLDPARHAGAAIVFTLPSERKSVQVVSRAAAPAELGLARDPRMLGVALRRMTIGRDTRCLVVEAGDPAWVDGFHGFEPGEGLRWTDGNATVPPSLLRFFDGPLDLTLDVRGSTQYLAVG